MNRTVHLKPEDVQLIEVEGYLFAVDVLYNKKNIPKLRVETY